MTRNAAVELLIHASGLVPRTIAARVDENAATVQAAPPEPNGGASAGAFWRVLEPPRGRYFDRGRSLLAALAEHHSGALAALTARGRCGDETATRLLAQLAEHHSGALVSLEELARGAMT